MAVVILGSEPPTRIAEAFVPLSYFTANCEEPIFVRSKWHILETIPILLPASRIAEIPVVFVLPEQSIGWWNVGSYRLSKHAAARRQQDVKSCPTKANHLESAK